MREGLITVRETEGNKGTDGGGKIGYYESNLPEQIAAILHYKGNGYPLLSITSEMIHQFIANIEVT